MEIHLLIPVAGLLMLIIIRCSINKMIEFYQTPLGKKLVSTLPQIMQESMQVGQSWGKEVGDKIYNSLKEKGYVKDKQ